MQTTIDSNKKLKQFFNKEFQYLRNEGKVIVPNSKYFGQIGSTLTEDISYENQLFIKLLALKNIFQQLVSNDLMQNYEIIPSPKLFEYRFKMDFVCSYNPKYEPFNRFGQRKLGNFNYVIDIDECNLIDRDWFRKIRNVYDYSKKLGIPNYDLKKFTGDLRYIVSRTYEDNGMLNIVTKSVGFKSQIETLAKHALNQGFESVNWLVNSKQTDISTGEIIRNWGEKNITVKLKDKDFIIGPNIFFQNNILCFEKLLDHVVDQIEIIPSEYRQNLYDLYCGTGVIGISLCGKFRQITGVELEPENVEIGNLNIQENKINNITLIREDVRKFSQQAMPHSTVIIDPPRSGLEENGINTVLSIAPEYIIYISCNPITQAHDINLLLKNYVIQSIKAFDLFPHTYHMENVIVLRKI